MIMRMTLSTLLAAYKLADELTCKHTGRPLDPDTIILNVERELVDPTFIRHRD